MMKGTHATYTQKLKLLQHGAKTACVFVMLISFVASSCLSGEGRVETAEPEELLSLQREVSQASASLDGNQITLAMESVLEEIPTDDDFGTEVISTDQEFALEEDTVSELQEIEVAAAEDMAIIDTDADQPVRPKEENVNTVTPIGGNKKKSETGILPGKNVVASASGERKNVVSASDSRDHRNSVPLSALAVEEPELPLKLISATYEDYGIMPEIVTAETLYQYPVEIGNPVEKNYYGKLTKKDEIIKVVLDTQPLEDEDSSVSGNSVSGNSVSGNTISETREQEEKGKETKGEKKETKREDVWSQTFETEALDSGKEKKEKAVSDNSIDRIRSVSENQVETEEIRTDEEIAEPEDAESEEEQEEYDYGTPVLSFAEGQGKELESSQGNVICMNSADIGVQINAGNERTVMEQICYQYGDKTFYIVDHFENASIKLPEDFYGNVVMSGKNEAGNKSEMMSRYYLVENDAPVVTISETKICTAPYRLSVTAEDIGPIVSGIDTITCLVNGEEYEMSDLSSGENICLADDLQIVSKSSFSLLFDELGEKEIAIIVKDNAGNQTEIKKTIEVTEPELVAVYMPEKFTIHIDPQQLRQREQIYSDEFTLKNVSSVDVKVCIKNISVMVKDEILEGAILKDCRLYLVAPDTGEKIPLSNGENEDVYSYKMLQSDTEGQGSFRIIGEVNEGSESTWKDGDISINVSLEFQKWKDTEEAE